MRINLDNTIKVMDFVEVCKTFQEDVDVTSGRYNVDGKSLLGVLAISSRPDLNARIVTTNNMAIMDFMEAIKPFAAEED